MSSFLLVLSSSQDHPALSSDFITVLKPLVAALPATQANPEHIRDLAPTIAIEWPLVTQQPEQALNAIRQQIAAMASSPPIDVNLVADKPERARMKRLLVADMDSTMIEQECIDELARKAGLYDKIAGLTERAMRGELDFNDALKARVAMLRGLSEDVIEKTWKEAITLTPGARTLIATQKKYGGKTALVSGGFTAFTDHVAKALGFDHHFANILGIKDGALDGTVAEPILGRDAKAQILKDLSHDCGLSASDTLAVGDGANDLAMIDIAGMGVAFRAKPATAKAAAYQVTHGDLTSLLYLQGIPRTEHAEHIA